VLRCGCGGRHGSGWALLDEHEQAAFEELPEYRRVVPRRSVPVGARDLQYTADMRCDVVDGVHPRRYVGKRGKWLNGSRPCAVYLQDDSDLHQENHRAFSDLASRGKRRLHSGNGVRHRL